MTRGEKYKHERIKRGLSQAALGREVGVTANTVARRERGELPVTQEAMLAIERLPIPRKRKG